MDILIQVLEFNFKRLAFIRINFKKKPGALHPDAGSTSKAPMRFCLLVGRSFSED
jgi:hypothetical protein